MWLNGLRSQCSLQEHVGLIPDLSQWVKYLPLPQAAAQVTDATGIQRIQHCYGYGIGLNCSSYSVRSLGTALCHGAGCKRTKKTKSFLQPHM